MKPFAVIILAAGKSERLGQPKQLIPYGGKTLVEHAVSIALQSGGEPVVVVLGSYFDDVRRVLEPTPARLVFNDAWQTGMSSSIAAGIDAVPEPVGRAIIMLVDQPFITSGHLRALAVVEAEVVASSYDGVIGTPCLFGRSYFDQLRSLQGDRGARELIRSLEPVSVPLPQSLDIDTVDDLKRLENYNLT